MKIEERKLELTFVSHQKAKLQATELAFLIKVIIQNKLILRGGITPFGRKTVQDRYVQRRVVCPKKAVTQNKEEKTTNQYAFLKH